MQWLDGPHALPPKLRSICDISAIVAHKPWMLTADHVARLVKARLESLYIYIYSFYMYVCMCVCMCVCVYVCVSEGGGGFSLRIRLYLSAAYHARSHACRCRVSPARSRVSLRTRGACPKWCMRVLSYRASTRSRALSLVWAASRRLTSRTRPLVRCLWCGCCSPSLVSLGSETWRSTRWAPLKQPIHDQTDRSSTRSSAAHSRGSQSPIKGLVDRLEPLELPRSQDTTRALLTRMLQLNDQPPVAPLAVPTARKGEFRFRLDCCLC
jgi:hypothetical protein